MSTLREANAGKEKLAGAVLTYVGTEEFQVPVAFAMGVESLKENEGTRGIVNPSTSATLMYCE